MKPVTVNEDFKFSKQFGFKMCFSAVPAYMNRNKDSPLSYNQQWQCGNCYPWLCPIST